MLYIILLEARRIRLDRIEVSREIIRLSSESMAVIVLNLAGGVIPSQMLRLGVKGFIKKSVPGEGLLKAIRIVSDGDHYFTASVAACLATDSLATMGWRVFRKELQIGQMLTDGGKVSQISIYLKLSLGMNRYSPKCPALLRFLRARKYLSANAGLRLRLRAASTNLHINSVNRP